MTHWISIPFYLWKNTFKRWLENPFPALVKIIIPALLATLGVVALAMFAQIERELENQLKRSSALRVHVSEYVSIDNAPEMILRTASDEITWSSRFGADKLRYTSQILAPAKMEFEQKSRSMPVFSETTPRLVGGDVLDPQNPPSVKLVYRDRIYRGSSVISLNGMKVQALIGEMPPWVQPLTGARRAVVIPDSMARPLKAAGYIHHIVADLESLDEVERFVAEVQAYTQADQRQVTITSAVHILRELKRIQGIQNVVRRLLVGGCCIILAMTLGSIAWLEYRQDSYLLALLRSFGTPTFILFIHAMVENLLLVMLGILSILATWEKIYEFILGKAKVTGFQVRGVPNLPEQDVWLIIIGGLLGVLLAMLPIAFGLRKSPGLVLQ